MFKNILKYKIIKKATLLKRIFMFIDTHCHINMIVKKDFDTLLEPFHLIAARQIVHDALNNGVTSIINVGTSLIESQNCVTLAEQFKTVYAAVGIHPNDCTADWKEDLNSIKERWFKNKHAKVVAIGECGLDRHYPGYNITRQTDAFKAHIELALEHNLPLVIHTRDAAQETLDVLLNYKNDPIKGVIHCFSEQLDFAQEAVEKLGFFIGIGGVITYPKNEYLRTVVRSISLESIILETDAPFLPIQTMRGKQNLPQYVPAIAQFVADLKQESLEVIAGKTTKNAKNLFHLSS